VIDQRNATDRAADAPREAREVRMAAGCARPVGSSAAAALPPGMHRNLALGRIRDLVLSRGKGTLADIEQPGPLGAGSDGDRFSWDIAVTCLL
jgi:hypothetical protein